MFETTNTLQHCLLQDTLTAGNIFTRKWHAIRLGNFYFFFALVSEKREQPVVISQEKTWKESPSKSFDIKDSVQSQSWNSKVKFEPSRPTIWRENYILLPTNFAQVSFVEQNKESPVVISQKKKEGGKARYTFFIRLVFIKFALCVRYGNTGCGVFKRGYKIRNVFA